MVDRLVLGFRIDDRLDVARIECGRIRRPHHARDDGGIHAGELRNQIQRLGMVVVGVVFGLLHDARETRHHVAMFRNVVRTGKPAGDHEAACDRVEHRRDDACFAAVHEPREDGVEHGRGVDAMLHERGAHGRFRQFDEVDRCRIDALLLEPRARRDDVDVVERRRRDRFPHEVARRLYRRIGRDDQCADRMLFDVESRRCDEREVDAAQVRCDQSGEARLADLERAAGNCDGNGRAAVHLGNLHVESGFAEQTRLVGVQQRGGVIVAGGGHADRIRRSGAGRRCERDRESERRCTQREPEQRAFHAAAKGAVQAL